MARRIRFIGKAEQRIAEDRLRILRFFRLHAQYGRGEIDRDGLSAAIRARDGLRQLSAERVGQEMRRLVVAPRAPETVVVMQESGILPIVLGGVGFLRPFQRLAAFEAGLEIAPSVALRLTGIGCKVEEDVERLTERLRLANAERDRMLAAVAAVRSFPPTPDTREARRSLYRLGSEAFRDAVALGVAEGRAEPDNAAWRDLYRLPDRWRVPAFPLGGRDVLGEGAPRGPSVGALLRAVEAWWIEQDFAPDAAALKARLQQMIAAEQ